MTIHLINSMGDDLSIVNSARVSYNKESKYEYTCQLCKMVTQERGSTTDDNCSHYDKLVTMWTPTLNKADSGLINYLMRERHGTPFESVVFQCRVHVPIKVAREWQRHRVGSYNEMSTRYVKMEPEFYIPALMDVREQVGKPGHYTCQTITDTVRANEIREIMSQTYAHIYYQYKALLDRGVAKELASFLLPLGLYTEFIWTVNLRSAFNFMSLRSDIRALQEIRYESFALEEIVKNIVPVAYAAWNDNGRHNP